MVLLWLAKQYRLLFSFTKLNFPFEFELSCSLFLLSLSLSLDLTLLQILFQYLHAIAQPKTTTTMALSTGGNPDWAVPPRGTVVRVGHLAQGCQQDECYRDPSKWKAVSAYSHQTSGDMRILDEEGDKVVAEALALAKQYDTEKISVIDLGCG